MAPVPVLQRDRQNAVLASAGEGLPSGEGPLRCRVGAGTCVGTTAFARTPPQEGASASTYVSNYFLHRTREVRAYPVLRKASWTSRTIPNNKGLRRRIRVVVAANARTRPTSRAVPPDALRFEAGGSAAYEVTNPRLGFDISIPLIEGLAAASRTERGDGTIIKPEHMGVYPPTQKASRGRVAIFPPAGSTRGIIGGQG